MANIILTILHAAVCHKRESRLWLAQKTSSLLCLQWTTSTATVTYLYVCNHPPLCRRWQSWECMTSWPDGHCGISACAHAVEQMPPSQHETVSAHNATPKQKPYKSAPKNLDHHPKNDQQEKAQPLVQIFFLSGHTFFYFFLNTHTHRWHGWVVNKLHCGSTGCKFESPSSSNPPPPPTHTTILLQPQGGGRWQCVCAGGGGGGGGVQCLSG